MKGIKTESDGERERAAKSDGVSESVRVCQRTTENDRKRQKSDKKRQRAPEND